jgi:hypothetical protein
MHHSNPRPIFVPRSTSRPAAPSRYYGVPGTAPGATPSSPLLSTPVNVPKYTMVLRRHHLGWQFLGSIEENSFWYLPHTRPDSFLEYFAKNPLKPTVIRYRDETIAVYISTDDNFRCPWKIVQKDTRKSFIPLRDWIFVSEIYSNVDNEFPTVWGRRVHRILPEIFDTCLLSYLGIDPKKKDYPLVLYHGTNLDNARGIMKDGFKIFKCVHEGGDKVTTEIADNKFISEKDGECRCRMMGPGIYGCSFVRAQLFAQKKYGQQAAIVRLVVNNDLTFYFVKNTDVCECGCAQPYVDHRGNLLKRHEGVYLANNSYPATTSPEWVVRNEKNVLATNFIFFPPKREFEKRPREDDDVKESNKYIRREWGGEEMGRRAERSYPAEREDRAERSYPAEREDRAERSYPAEREDRAEASEGEIVGDFFDFNFDN